MGWYQLLCSELQRVGALLLPPACLLCGLRLPPDADPAAFCPACAEGVMPLATGRCPRCALPPRIPAAAPRDCDSCLRTPPPFDRVLAVGPYTGTLQQAIQRFKYHGQLPLEVPLGRLLATAVGTGNGGLCPDLLVPVPLHPGRLRQRGYNQALQLARQVGRHLGIAVEPHLLQRTRVTLNQRGLDANARGSNLLGAFAVTRPLAGQHLLLVDDVMTTGATVRECAALLRQAGAREVDVAVVGRA